MTYVQAKGLRRATRGFSLVEVLAATVIVGIVMVGALNALGAFVRGQQKLAVQSRGRLLAQELLAEAMEKPYEEPDDSPAFGVEVSEAASRRETFDDIDDYHGWSESPPRQRDGSVLSHLEGWERRVVVERVKANSPSIITTSDEGLKRITVEVLHDGVVTNRLTAIRSRPWPTPPFE